MSASLQSASVYSDLQGMESLRHGDKKNSPETLRFVAQQFEALFMQMMLKTAHTSGEDDSLFASEQTEFYQDWYDKQLAIHLSSGSGVGIADMLVQQLKQQMMGQNSSLAADQLQDNPVTNTPAPRASLAIPVTEAGQGVQEDTQPQIDSPDSFVRHLLPLAEKAGNKLGVSPEVLLAQAALETGWGKRVSQSSSGESSHNLFNIKADHRWQGDSVNVSTLEYRDGIAVRESARFRAYDSYESSFDDYVDFIRSGERYQKALSVAGNDQAYTHELARAGYATDPDYSSKINNIVDRLSLDSVSQAVKL